MQTLILPHVQPVSGKYIPLWSTRPRTPTRKNREPLKTLSTWGKIPETASFGEAGQGSTLLEGDEHVRVVYLHGST